MKKKSISIAKGKGSMTHNNREFITDNVDKNRTKDNVIYKQESLADAYEHCFGQAILDYNAKQKRKDRHINGVNGYIDKIRNSKNGEKLFYENIVQVGNMFDSQVGTEQGDICKQILDDYMKSFQERNPHLYVFNAVMHLDEQTPHLHIDYIPIATDYQKGLNVRNSLDKALKQQGIEGKANKYQNRTIAWQKGEKKHIEAIMNVYGLERAENKGLDQEHMTVNQYKAVVNEIQNEVKELPRQIDSKPTLFDKGKVSVEKKDLEQLEQRARLSLMHEKASQQLVSELKEKQKEMQEMTLAAAKSNAKAQEEIAKAELEYKKYQALYYQQYDLNHINTSLMQDVTKQRQKIEELENKNRSLMNAEERAQRASAELLEARIEIVSLHTLKRENEALKAEKKQILEELTKTKEEVVELKHKIKLLEFIDNTFYSIMQFLELEHIYDNIKNMFYREKKADDLNIGRIFGKEVYTELKEDIKEDVIKELEEDGLEL